MAKKKPLGVILYKGPSMLDGNNIVVIATGLFNNRNNNVKIGDMVQTWILKPDVSPLLSSLPEARRSHLYSDFSVCGDCKHRKSQSCYVSLIHAPDNVYKAYHRDRYLSYTPDMKHLFKDRHIRIGSYGDPAAVPMSIWHEICGETKDYTGYTHQWNNKKLDSGHIESLKQYCMASCDTIDEQKKACNLGWRTFRIRLPKDNSIVLNSKNLMKQTEILEDEFICPASNEAGKISTCEKCGACNGTNSKYKKNVCIIAHGLDFKINNLIIEVKRILNKEGRKGAKKNRKIKRNIIKI